MFVSKWKLFLGLILLTLGIVLRLFTEQDTLAVSLIILGVLLKAGHIVGMIQKKSYQPGIELIILGLGLSLFFFGLYICQDDNFARFFIIIGLALKIVFVVLFIRKMKSK